MAKIPIRVDSEKTKKKKNTKNNESSKGCQEIFLRRLSDFFPDYFIFRKEKKKE